MSIQNRLLLVYTSIYVVAFVLFATVVYILPRNRLVAEIDHDLFALAAQIQSGSMGRGEDNVLRIPLPPDLINLETASTFFVVSDVNGGIVLRSQNLAGLAGFEGYLDPSGFQETSYYNQVAHGDTQLRVLTVPFRDPNAPGQPIVGYLQVARLLDSFESFNRFLVIALFVGFAAATASLFLAVLLTPGSFRPLEDIANVARQITNADDLSRRVPDTGRTDEIGVLAQSINQTLERLERLFKTQQRLVADVSHELRTPLTAIRGNVDLMRRMGNGDPQSLLIIQEEVDRMTRLVGDLLLLARADAGELSFQKRKVELDLIFFEVYHQATLISDKIEVSIGEVDQVAVYGDPDRLKQLLFNLAGNAIKYTPDGGKVKMGLSKSDGWAYVQISDTGIGIPADDLPYIFDRFYRVDKARSRSQGGSGLGLSIAKWIATSHGGDITVTSQVGDGSTFIVMLPVLVENVQVAMPPEFDSGESRQSIRVLGTNLIRRRNNHDTKTELGKLS
ncbi:MAG: HAMP domain-containing histidine kinase [Anaerolineales bacterium]|nr:HAMP domain-containing histidine kinase [Anaerolineales bacterium]